MAPVSRHGAGAANTNTRMVGRRVKWLRKLREISQDELGRLVGLGQTAISRIEMGLRDLSFDEAKRMARALGCSLDDLDGSDGPITITITPGPTKPPDDDADA